MLKDASVVCYDANIRQFHAQECKPGDPAFIMSIRHLLEYGKCADRWIASEGEMGRPIPKMAQLLRTLQLNPAHLDTQFALRPETYTVTTQKCPVCGSVSVAVGANGSQSGRW